MKTILPHGVIAFLYGLGLTLPLLGALDLLAYGWTAVLILAATTGLLMAASLNRWTVIGASVALPLAAGIWLLLMGGMDTATEVVRGMTLQLSGQTAALPLIAGEAAILFTLVMGLSAWFLTVSGIGLYPAAAVLLLAVLILWLGDKAGLMLYALPAVAACITLMVMNNHEELPLRRVLPVAAVAVGISFLIVPSGGVVSQPLKETADSLRQTIYDYVFFTEPRTLFSLSMEGYYPQGASQLGGTATPTEHPVMMVSTPRRVYLRGTVKDEYTGRVWRNTTGGRRYLWVSPRWTGVRESTFDMLLPQGRLGEANGLLAVQQVKVQMLSQNASTLFVPQRVRTVSPGGSIVPYFNIASEIFGTRELEAGDTYTVSAPLMVAGDAGLGTLISACENTTDTAYADIAALYTKLPDHLQELVYDIARKASDGASTPYEQAFAIQNYLSRNFRYTLEVEDQPEDLDFVTNFLINTKEGYCTYFASAMTVLCRMIGLPARYVEGYLATPDENGNAYVTGLQAHAWTEVYFAGFGWLTFDATPSQNNTVTPPGGGSNDQSDDPDNSDSEPTPTPTPPSSGDSETPPPEEEPTPTPSEDAVDEPEHTPDPEDDAPNQQPPEQPANLTWLWILLAVLAIIAAVTVRILLTMPQKQSAKADTEKAFRIWVQAVHDALRVMGLSARKSESPMAYMRRLDGLQRLPVELLPLGEAIALIYYGRVAPEPEEAEMARADYQALWQAMKPLEKLRLLMQRAFLPAKKTDFTKR